MTLKSIFLKQKFFARFACVVLLASLFSVGFTVDAEAATKSKKNCQNYVSKQLRNSCLAVKRARFNMRHTVIARPQTASFLMDADTGKVLESENADAQRFPASLTKMMTLYMTFESLKKGKLKLDQHLPVSEHASQQPQTNIALQPGDTIAVKDAILSLVVRSANDSAVVLAEAMGGTEAGFGQKMTAKARALGMKRTMFYNASGLPEPRQHTTARDMAILGLALKRDFPQYYPFFKTESFSYNGKTYGTHNRVMTRYDGVDGIKTGYIRASGFNLVTSAKKDGHNVVGVVLGGPTWRERDDKMIAMLDRNFDRLIAKNTTAKETQIAAPTPEASPFEIADATISSAFEEEVPEGQGDLNAEIEEPASKVIIATPAKVEKKVAARAAANWGIQVGAYARKSDAVKASASAIKHAAKTLGSARVSIEDTGKGAKHYRARLANLTQVNAAAACKALSAKKINCFTYKN